MEIYLKNTVCTDTLAYDTPIHSQPEMASNDDDTSGLGTGHATKTDEFSEKFQRGAGVIFNPKIYIADFGNFKQEYDIDSKV